MFGSVSHTRAATAPDQKFPVGTMESSSQDKDPQSLLDLDRSFDGASTFSIPPMPVTSSDEEDEDTEDCVEDKSRECSEEQGRSGGETAAEQRKSTELRNEPAADEGMRASQSTGVDSERDGEEFDTAIAGAAFVADVRGAVRSDNNSADDEVAARLKMEKVVRRMAAEFEEELAQANAKAAAEKDEIAKQLQAEKAEHAQTLASSEAAAAEAAAAMTAMQQELDALRGQLAAVKQDMLDKEKAAADMAHMHITMKSEAAEAAAKAADALSTVLAWGSSSFPERPGSAPLPTSV